MFCCQSATHQLASQWKSHGQNLMTPCVAPHACHTQKAIKAVDWTNPVRRFWRRRFLKSTNAHGQRTNPTWQRKPQMKNLNLPERLSQGIHDGGIKFQTGPVTNTMMINNAMALEMRTPSESGILSSAARLELYHTFSTDARRVVI